MTEGQVFVKFAKQDLNASKFALLYQNDEAGKEGAEGVKAVSYTHLTTYTLDPRVS